MSVLSSSESPSFTSGEFSCTASDTPQRTLSGGRLTIHLDIDPACVAKIASQSVRLVERFMPGVHHFLSIDGAIVRIKIRQGAIAVCQADSLGCRLARTHGVLYVRVEFRTVSEGAVYGAEMRGRSRTVPVAG